MHYNNMLKQISLQLYYINHYIMLKHILLSWQMEWYVPTHKSLLTWFTKIQCSWYKMLFYVFYLLTWRHEKAIFYIESW